MIENNYKGLRVQSTFQTSRFFQRMNTAINDVISGDAETQRQLLVVGDKFKHLAQENLKKSNIPLDFGNEVSDSLFNSFYSEINDGKLTIGSNDWLSSSLEYGYQDGNQIVPPYNYLRPAIRECTQDIVHVYKKRVIERYFELAGVI